MEKTKLCCRCGIVKSIEKFYFRKDRGTHWGHCKSCHKLSDKQYRTKNIIAHRERAKNYYYQNREQVIARNKKWSRDNQKRVSRNKSKWRKNKCESSLFYKTCHSIFNGIWYSLKSKDRQHKSNRKWEVLVGYSIHALVAHMEPLFHEGMTWDNHGEWEFDHIIPIAHFLKDEDMSKIKECWALSNLRPIWALENQQKGGKHYECGNPIL